MALAAIESAIAHLMIERAAAHGNTAYQDRINDKLTDLYNQKYLLLKRLAAKKAA